MKERILRIFIPIIAGALLMLLAIWLAPQSIWATESETLFITQGGWGEIWKRAGEAGRFPFYYFALKIWLGIVGSSLVGARIFSGLCGAISILVIFRTTKNWLGIREAATLTFILSLAPLGFKFLGEARGISFYLMILIFLMGLTQMRFGEKISRIWRIWISAGLISLMLLGGIVVELTSQRTDMKGLMEALVSVAEPGQKIIVEDHIIYRDAKFYENQKNPVIERGEREKKLRAEKGVWFITSAKANYTTEMKSPLKGRKVKNQVANKDFLALFLVK